MRRSLLLLFPLLLLQLISKAQINNEPIEQRFIPDTTRSGDVQFSLYNFNFIRNYEFFNDFQDGYTLFGTQLEPRLVYYANSRLVLTAGAHLRKDFGKEGISKTYPIFSIKYKWRNTSLITGAIEGNMHHRFIEPLFDYERKITNPVEYGTQLIVNKPSLFLDVFINWNKMTDRNSPDQEQIYAGGSADITIAKTDRQKLSVPAQLFVFHQGGQIDTNPEPLKTIVNAALGFKYSHSSYGFVKALRTENYVMLYKDNSPEVKSVYKSGNALFFNAGADTRWGNLVASYYKGNKYISPVGMPIYQSVSQQIAKPGYSEKDRELIILRYLYQKHLLSNFYLDFRVEPVIDLRSPGSKPVEFFHSLFLVYKQDFKLFKVK